MIKKQNTVKLFGEIIRYKEKITRFFNTNILQNNLHIILNSLK